MNTIDLLQRSPEWHLARVGSLGASQIADATARTKTGWGASRANIMAQLIVERLTGEPTQGYLNAAMQHGLDTEPEALSAYEFRFDVEVVPVGLVQHPRISGTHASPDGLVGKPGLVEVKCPQPATHIETLLPGWKLPEKYQKQVDWQMACTGREWADFVSYHPKMPPEMRLFVVRVERDDKRIEALEEQVAEFLAELVGKVASLRKLYALPEPAREKPRRPWGELPPSTQIVLTCQDPAFLRWLVEEHDTFALASHEAEGWIKSHCGVTRKRDVLPGTEAAALWQALHGSFTVWRDYAEQAA
jgi:putative phage-type endonuclease